MTATRGTAETPPSHRLIRYELELQTAMIEALRGDSAKGRMRLSRLGSHPTVANYEQLAEAVVSAMEGDVARAGSALLLWEQAVTTSGMGAALRVGNEWALAAVRRQNLPFGDSEKAPRIARVLAARA